MRKLYERHHRYIAEVQAEVEVRAQGADADDGPPISSVAARPEQASSSTSRYPVIPSNVADRRVEPSAIERADDERSLVESNGVAPPEPPGERGSMQGDRGHRH